MIENHLEREWQKKRWNNIKREYAADDIAGVRGSVRVAHTLADIGSRRLWNLLNRDEPVRALGAMTGAQAVQQVKAGLEAIYLSGWQVAADANLAGKTYPDQSLYPANSVPQVVRRINEALMRADEIECSEGGKEREWFAPIVADAEAGFGGILNAYELMRAMIEAGASGVHFEDQLASEKKCGHLGGKVLVPTSSFIRTLTAARLASDVLDVPTVLIARTDADAAQLITSDIDPYDEPFIMRDERTAEGFYRFAGNLDAAIGRAKAYAPYADVLWCETSQPDLEEAKRFAEGVHAAYPGKILAYNCSPSFNWKKNLDAGTIKRFQHELGSMGYKFQFITLAGFHSLNFSMFSLSRAYREDGMTAYAKLQEQEFSAEHHGYTATKHQREVGTAYFDKLSKIITKGKTSTLAMEDSTEAAQFHRAAFTAVTSIPPGTQLF